MLGLSFFKSRRGKNTFADDGPSSYARNSGKGGNKSLNKSANRSGNAGGGVSLGGIAQTFRWILGLSLCVALLYGITVGLFAAYRLATNSEYFALKNVDIRGARHFRREDILQTAGLVSGKNILTLSIAAMEDALSGNPWVLHVAVKRQLPDAFEIQISERVPAFWMLKDGVLHYTDREGVIIAPVEPGNFLSLPTLEILPGGETLQARAGDLMEALRQASLPLDLAAVSTIRLSSAKGLEILMGNMNLTVCISPDDWDKNLLRLNSVLRDLARRGELKNTREIWLADGSVWVIMQPVQPM